MSFSKEYLEAQRYKNMVMARMVMLIKTRPNWKARIIMQPFFGSRKNSGVIKFKRPIKNNFKIQE